MNVKVGQYPADDIAEHLARYPDIPVVTDVHTAALLDHPMVHGVSGLEAEKLQALVHSASGVSEASSQMQSLDGLHEGAGTAIEMGGGQCADVAEAADGLSDASFGVDVPIFTIALGTFRELRLAEQYGGDVLESVGAIAEDAAAIVIGGKLGGAVGALLGPIGALVGAFIGAGLARGAVKQHRSEELESDLAELSSKLGISTHAGGRSSRNSRGKRRVLSRRQTHACNKR